MKLKQYRLAQRAASLSILFALLVGASLPAFAQTRRTTRRAQPRLSRPAPRPAAPVAPAVRHLTLNEDHTFRVRMNEQISSETARIGDRFTTTVVDPVYVNGMEAAPAGSIITGRVTDVKRAQRRSQAGEIGVKFITLQTPDGRSYPINGSLTSMATDAVNYDSEGQVSGRSSMQRNAIFIGGGAGAGAIIGAIAGGGRGAGVGAGVGAGLGVAGALFSRGEEAVVRPGTQFGVLLNQRITLPAWRDRAERY